MTDEGCSPLCFLSFLCNFAVYDGFAVIGCEEGLYLGFRIEGLATEDDVWEETLLAVFLQGAATEFETTAYCPRRYASSRSARTSVRESR